MASGKQSPRQKMINLMYLVFIAMLAMNVGKEVLSAFGLMNKKISESNTRAEETNAASYKALALKASEQAKQFGEAKIKTDSIKVMSDDLYNFLEDLKGKIMADVENKTEYESMDKSQFLDEYFFKGGKISSDANNFLSNINNYSTEVVKILGKRDLANIVASRFETKDVTDREGVTKNWLNYNFEGFPLIASVTKLTQMQADIKATEADALSALLQKELSDAVSMTNYDAIVVLEKSAYYPGDKLKGKIVLGKNDPTLTAEKVILNDREVAKSKIQAGQVILDGSVGGVGDKTLKGTFIFKENGEDIPIQFSGGYTVIPKPNSAVVSADKMNVVYKGLSNPITISVPGVSSNKVSASAPGLRKVNGDKYSMNPTGAAGSDVAIRVSATLPDGSKINTPKTYRIKDIPPAVGMVRGQYGTVRMPKSSATQIAVNAGLPDFLFDLKLQVLSFKVKVPGQLTVNCNGGLSSKAKQMIAKSRRGDVITIYEIKAKVTNSGYQIKKVLPVNIEITN